MTFAEECLEYYWKEMEEEPLKGKGRDIALMMAEAILKRKPSITTKEEFLYHMNDFSGEPSGD